MIPPKKVAKVTPAKPAAKKDSSSEEESSDDDEPAKPAAKAATPAKKAQKKESSSEEESDSDEEAAPVQKKKIPPVARVAAWQIFNPRALHSVPEAKVGDTPMPARNARARRPSSLSKGLPAASPSTTNSMRTPAGRSLGLDHVSAPAAPSNMFMASLSKLTLSTCSLSCFIADTCLLGMLLKMRLLLPGM